MTNLISGKEALIALANGETVHYRDGTGVWCVVENNMDLSNFLDDSAQNWMSFRLKPRTITINGIEVPAPFKPKYGDTAFVLSKGHKGYRKVIYKAATYSVFGAWRTEDEIKQVVAALRQIFGGV